MVAVHVLHQVEVVVGVAVDQVPRAPEMVGAGQPLRPARRLVEQGRLAGTTHRLLAVAVEVLAHERGLVPRLLEHRRDGPPVVEGREPERVLVAVDVVVVGVLPRQEAGPRRAAQRVRREGVLEGQPPPLQQPSYVRHPAQVVPPHVVGLDHQHVRPRLLRLLHRRRLGRDQRLARMRMVTSTRQDGWSRTPTRRKASAHAAASTEHPRRPTRRPYDAHGPGHARHAAG